MISVGITLALLFAAGFFRGYMLHMNGWRDGLEVLLLGTGIIAVGVMSGLVVNSLLRLNKRYTDIHMRTYKLVVVSNRLPISVTKRDGKLHFEASSGGLATAMSTLSNEDHVWVGWPGIAADELDGTR